MFRYSKEQAGYIRSNIAGRLISELTSAFNAHFGVELKESQIRAFVKNNGLTSGLDSRFQKGREPFNKGKGKMWAGGEDTQFRKGHTPHNYLPVGTERVNADDYVDIKIADPNRWRGKHLIVWEQHNKRSVPAGHAVIFGDGNRRNFDPNNLILVTRGQLAIMNRRGLIHRDADLTRTGVIMADIYKKIGERKRGKRST
ncbi:HNH endonuclease signature motif containing protein [Paenibacillus aurantiacus]|uniref:HNH endonuclease signature motif containing protein n=1 Tax=Paenibacillus aurantiacus TaxID=1936118 RepID=A0ABV5KXU3_9BACL